MKKPSFNPQQHSTLRSMVTYWDELDNREDRSQVMRSANGEIQNLLHTIPAINILRAVAYYVKNYQEEK